MRISLTKLFIGFGLLLLASCNSNSKNKDSVVHNQSKLLSEFNASLTKIVSLEDNKVDTLSLDSDSIEWGKELTFLSYLDQLDSPNFYQKNQYAKDSTVLQTLYTPKDSSNNIRFAKVDFKSNTSHYEYSIRKKRMTQNSGQLVKVAFKKYHDQRIVDSYTIKGVQKSPYSDSITYFVKGIISY